MINVKNLREGKKERLEDLSKWNFHGIQKDGDFKENIRGIYDECVKTILIMLIKE